jgi:7,8-dihydropterin-6-yl-methyl-4-(beta-D-ribofuranosyl)aminobenzene 5'-phosphate synthase
MKITTLIEDTKQDDRLVNEFGLSLFIESNGTNILLDTGSSGCFLQNSNILGVDLKKIKYAIITHAHADHAGGLDTFLKTNDTATVYMHKNAVYEHYGNIGAKLPPFIGRIVHPLVKNSKAFSKYIGLDKDTIKRHEKRIKFITKMVEISNDIFLITDISNSFPKPEGNKFLLALKNGRLAEDDFKHELILLIKENDGIVVFSGCCHNGILNIIETVKHLFKDQTIKAIVGGLHLKLQPQKDNMAGTRKDVEFIASEIIDRGIQRICTGHCTGSKAYNLLRNRLNERISPLFTGSIVDL